jgi:molybdenum cofactor cytidylyltransferase/nicotine blue oxidoreductase
MQGMTVHGLLLAAGAGQRYGGPKVLAHDSDGSSWLRRGIEVLHEGGCHWVTVVLGAEAESAMPLLEGTRSSFVVADDWAEGMSASLQAGLDALDERETAALVHLVDLPDVGSAVVARMLAGDVVAGTLRRATYDGKPGHPVVIGREHWPGVVATAQGDRGARDYLAAHDHEAIECGDLATGVDVDRPVRD